MTVDEQNGRFLSELEFLVETIREQSIRGCRVGMGRLSALALLGPELGRERRGKVLAVDFVGYREGTMLLVHFRHGVLESMTQDLVVGVPLSVLSASLSTVLVEAPSLRVGNVYLECADGRVAAVALV